MKNNTNKSKKSKKQHVIVRSYSAGVFAGVLKSRKGQEVVLTDARRIWKWAGAASLSQLAIDGVRKPNECQFPEAVKEITILQAIEIIPMTIVAQNSVNAVPIWRA